ncbi:MAG TPA: tetratricopeptide repeat protein, partial [Geomobilimonas sp.]|nr:tetratricopeptide repeat protein [Geomobilimonas sp.]
MSTAKEKYLASAQKFIAKGQVDRAIKDYEQIVALDPNDIRHRQRLAELLVKVNRKDDAVAEYKAIGKYYSDNTYFLKAIAVFKQIQKLTPADIDISLALATLNEKQGLTGNALTEYGIVLAHYQRAGRLNDALKVLESMLNLDPENLTTQLQFAELHFSAGQVDKAYEEFTQLALLLWKKGNHEAFSQVCTRIQALFPEQKEFLLDFIATLLAKGETAGVVLQLQQFIRTDVANLRAWQLLADVCRRLGETEKLKGVLQQAIKLFPGEMPLRADLVRLHLDAGNAPVALDLLAGSELAFVAAGEVGRMESLYTEIEKLLPKDGRVLTGLKSLYETAGDKEKLTALTARMAPPPEASPAPARQTSGKAAAMDAAGEKSRTVASVPTSDSTEVSD